MAAPCAAALNVRRLDAGGAKDADTRGDTGTQAFVNPIHAEDEEDAEGELDGQQENEGLAETDASKD